MDTMTYKSYEGTADIDMERSVCRGKILFINDLVTYESETPAGLKREFEAAVDDYLETCTAIGREAQKPLKGMFNVRISPDLHKSLMIRSIKDKVSQNEVVARSLDAYLNGSTSTNHTVNLKVSIPEENLKILRMNSGADLQWEKVGYVH